MRTVKRTNPSLARRLHGFSVDDHGHVRLRIDRDLFDAVNASGEITNIYILDRRGFVEKSAMEWAANQKVQPIGVVFVRGSDLPSVRRPGVTLKITKSTSGPSLGAR